MIIWSLFQAAGGIAGTALRPQLMLARIGLGATEAPCFPSATRSTSDWFDVKDRGRPSGLYTSGAYIGPTIAPPILTGLMLAYNWRVMFIVMGVAGVVAAIFWFLVYRDPKLQELDAQDEAYLRANREAGNRAGVAAANGAALFRFKGDVGADAGRILHRLHHLDVPDLAAGLSRNAAAHLDRQDRVSSPLSVPLICRVFRRATGKGWLSRLAAFPRHGTGQEPPPAVDRRPVAVGGIYRACRGGDDADPGGHLHRRVDVLHAVRHYLQMDPGDRGDAAGLLRVGGEQPEFRGVSWRHAVADRDRVHRRHDRLVRDRARHRRADHADRRRPLPILHEHGDRRGAARLQGHRRGRRQPNKSSGI